jgi:hypothetical protein
MPEPTGVKIKIGVTSSCGHWWHETRPPNVAMPVNGELRVCGHPDHYPQQFTVTYSEPIEVT